MMWFKDCKVALKVAVTDAALRTLMEQVLVPVQAPVQPVNAKPGLGVAVSVRVVPLSKFAMQVLPQSIPEGELTTVPVPEPAALTLITTDVGGIMPASIAPLPTP
ncbi:MAG: hypothetical protein H0X25_04045 [Acidobacteriales bacterium]|nr:hypothetical protein [Terriglobales bacterium]